MTIGTRILLALSAVFIVVLVAYYGFFNDPVEPLLVADDPAALEAEIGRDSTGAGVPHASAAPSEEYVPRGIEMGRPVDERDVAVHSATDDAWHSDAPPSDRVFDPTAIRGSTGTVSPVARDDHENETGDRLDDRHSFLPLTRIVTGRGSVGKEGDNLAGGQADRSVDVAQPAETESTGNSEVGSPGAAGTSGGGAEAPRPLAPAQIEPPAFTIYRVQNGDTLSSIAESWFGTPHKWDLIAKANPQVDPNRLRIDQVLRLPPRNAERVSSPSPSSPAKPKPAAANRGENIHVVKSGETLSSIAGSYYGDNALWKRIYEANHATIGSSPNTLKVGTKLKIPAR